MDEPEYVPVCKRIILPKLVSFWIPVLPALEYNRNNSKKIGNHDLYAQEILLTGIKQELLSSAPAMLQSSCS